MTLMLETDSRSFPINCFVPLMLRNGQDLPLQSLLEGKEVSRTQSAPAAQHGWSLDQQITPKWNFKGDLYLISSNSPCKPWQSHPCTELSNRNSRWYLREPQWEWQLPKPVKCLGLWQWWPGSEPSVLPSGAFERGRGKEWWWHLSGSPLPQWEIAWQREQL